jgi:hypothetical protein
VGASQEELAAARAAKEEVAEVVEVRAGGGRLL